MNRICYLHIGMGRCGSSAIQHFAAANQQALQRKGILYPSSGDLGFPQQRGGNAQQIATDPVGPQAAMDAAIAFMAGSPDTRFLLSSEFLYSMHAREISHFMRGLDQVGIKLFIIAYVREQREWLLSRYAQAVKSRRWPITLEQYLRDRYATSNLNFNERFGHLSGLVGRDNLAVRLFQRDRLSGGDVRADLFGLCGIDIAELIDADVTTNASASVLELEVMRAVNEILPTAGFNHRRFLQRSQSFIEAKGWPQSRDMHRLVDPALMREIALYYQDSNAAFQAEFFPGTEGPLFRTKIPQDYDVFREEERLNARSIALLVNYFMDLTDRQPSGDAPGKPKPSPRKPASPPAKSAKKAKKEKKLPTFGSL